MEIESIPFTAFYTLTSCTHALNDSDNHGCHWYATTDRRFAGRIYLDAAYEAFRFSQLHFVRSGWEIFESPCIFDQFEDAERALIESLSEKAGMKEVTVKDKPARMRFGKGRTRTEHISPRETPQRKQT